MYHTVIAARWVQRVSCAHQVWANCCYDISVSYGYKFKLPALNVNVNILELLLYSCRRI
jgi:hypothetical protein